MYSHLHTVQLSLAHNATATSLLRYIVSAYRLHRAAITIHRSRVLTHARLSAIPTYLHSFAVTVFQSSLPSFSGWVSEVTLADPIDISLVQAYSA